MRIDGYRTQAVRVPFDETIAGTHVILWIETTDGLEGVGFVSRIAPAAVKPFISVVEGYLDQLIGQNPLNIEAITTVQPKYSGPAGVLRKGGGLPGYEARAASLLDIALWDLKGKHAGLPVYQLMGGFRDRVNCYASWRVEPGLSSGDLARSAEFLVAEGFRAMKFHVRDMTRQQTVEHMRVLRDAVGPGLDIMVDAKEAWDAKEAIRAVNALAPFEPYWIEDPISLDDYTGMQHVRESVDAYICAGESYTTITPFRRLLEHRSADIAMIDLDVGLSGFLKIAHIAEAFDVPVVTHLATEILAHGIAAVPNGLTVEYYPWAVPLLSEPLALEDGQLVMPDRPGLGLEFNQKALEQYALA